MKVFDFETIRETAQQMSPLTWYEWVDDALRRKDEFQMPPKVRIRQDNGDYYNIMPVLWEKKNLVMVKTIGRHHLKQGEHRPAMMGDLLLYEADIGKLKAVMDAEYITTLRTGAVAAHSAFLFSDVLGGGTISLLGLGNIMTVFFETLLEIRKKYSEYKPLMVRLYRHHNQEKRFMEHFRKAEKINFILTDTYEETIRDSDLIVSAVTKADMDFAPDACYKPGVTVIPVCTLGFQNCDLFFDKVYTDEIEQIRGFKYFNQFHSVTNLSDVLLEKREGRSSDKERILVYNYGIGIHDLYFAEKFYEKISGAQIPYRDCKTKYFI